jgi:Cupin domain
MSRTRTFMLICATSLLVAAGYAGRASATPSSNSTSTLLARGTFPGPFTLTRQVTGTGAWEATVSAQPGLDVATQAITFQPGGHSGWHTHPGPVFITVVSGTMTFYESQEPTCPAIVRTAGQGYLDTGEHAHLARNETGSPAVNLVTYLAPPGAALRVDQPEPANCAFLSNQPAAPSALTFSLDGRTVTLQWVASPGALDYILDVGRASGGIDIFSAAVGPTTTLTVAAPPGRYFVRVRARNASGASASSPEVVINVP